MPVRLFPETSRRPSAINAPSSHHFSTYGGTDYSAQHSGSNHAGCNYQPERNAFLLTERGAFHFTECGASLPPPPLTCSEAELSPATKALLCDRGGVVVDSPRTGTQPIDGDLPGESCCLPSGAQQSTLARRRLLLASRASESYPLKSPLATVLLIYDGECARRGLGGRAVGAAARNPRVAI